MSSERLKVVKVDLYEDNSYRVYDTLTQETLFVGTISDCFAFIMLKEEDRLL